MKRAILTSTVALGLLSNLAYAENFLQVYQHANAYDAQLKSEESGYLATLENKPQALAGKKPQVNFSASAGLSQTFTLYDGKTNGDANTSGSLTGSYNLNVTKSVYNRALDAQIDKVDSAIVQAKIQLDGQRQAIILRVAQPYFSYLLAEDNFQLANSEQAAFKRQLDQVNAYFEAGRSAITDVRESEASYNQSVARAVGARKDLDIARENLRVLTGQSYQSLFGPQPNMPLAIPAPQKIEAWVETAKKSSKTLQAARQAIEVAQKEIDIQRSSERNPVVSIYAGHTGSFSESSSSSLDPRSLGANVGIQVNIPLYQGGTVPSKIRQAQHQFRQAEQQYEYQERLIEQQVRSAYVSIEATISQVKAQQRALISAQTAADATKVGFEVGTRTAVDVLIALQQVFSARRDYASSRYNYLLSTLQLRDAAGTISENDVRQMSALLNKKY